MRRWNGLSVVVASCTLGASVAACGTTDAERAEHRRAVETPPRAHVATTRNGLAILGCHAYCRASNVNDANREAPEQDVFPPYAAQWVYSRDWRPLPDGTAPIKVKCDAGLRCEGALFVTIYHPTKVLTASQRVVGKSDLVVPPHRTRTIGVPLDRSGLRRVRAVLAECRRYRASATGFPPDPTVGLTIDVRASRDRLPTGHRNYVTWVDQTAIVCY